MRKLSPTQEEALSALKAGRNLIGFRSSTWEALARERPSMVAYDGITPKLVGNPPLEILRENMEDHRTRRLIWRVRHDVSATYDTGQASYEWYDQLYRCKVAGLEIAGLLAKAVSSRISAWVMGMMPEFRFENEDAQKLVDGWWEDNHHRVLQSFFEATQYGDSFLVVNADETSTVLPPHVVYSIVNDDDYSERIGWFIRQVYHHPTEWFNTMTIEDEYTAKARIRRLHKSNSKTGTEERYPNLIGEVPIAHLGYGANSNEAFGHPICEPIIAALHAWGQLFADAHEAVHVMGHPLLATIIQGGIKDIVDYMEQFGTTKEDANADGTDTTYTQLDMGDGIITNGDVKAITPGSFVRDNTIPLMEMLFLMIIEHLEIPEFIWGGAIASSKASAETQMAPFAMYIEKERAKIRDWVLHITRLVVKYFSVLYPTKVKADEKFDLIWKPLVDEDGKLTQDSIEIAMKYGLLDATNPDVVDLVLKSLPNLDVSEEQLDKIKAWIGAKNEEADRIARGMDEPFVGDDESAEDDESEDEQETLSPAEQLERQWREADEKHTGVMVAFEIPLETATDLTRMARQAGIDNVMAPEDLHITLVYVGDSSGKTDEDKQRAIKALSEREFGAVTGKIGGIGRFNASESSGGKDVIYASFDSPTIGGLQSELELELESLGFVLPSQHGFTPHITLAYVEPGADISNLVIPTTELTFETFTLYWGDEKTRFEMLPTMEAVMA